MRWLVLVAGLALVAIAFAAATRVADTREGLIAEVITLFGGAGGVILLLYGLVPRRRPISNRRLPRVDAPGRRRQVPSASQFWIGIGGIALAVILVTGLAVSGGPLLAILGFAVLLPMAVGSAFLSVRFLRFPHRAYQQHHADQDQHRGPENVPVHQAKIGGEHHGADHDEGQSEQN